PARQVAINGITLLFQGVSRCFVLFLNCYAPVVVKPAVTSNHKQAAVFEKRIAIQISVTNAELQIRNRLDNYVRVYFSKAFVECRYLGVDHETYPRQRLES